MKKILLSLSIVLFSCTIVFAQVNEVANFNRADLEQNETMPYYKPTGAGNIGIRSVWVADDLDQDGKPEVLITDYSNNGRVHVLELNGDNLELVWSSPIPEHADGSGSTPRWVRTGDLDGDGKGEIIFPLAKGNLNWKVQVWEWDGVNDNSYVLAIELESDAFVSQGLGNFMSRREVAAVFDFDGDGSDELIMSNTDHNTYILGITGDIPGFGGWQIEGGLASTGNPYNSKDFSKAPYHFVPADLNGDGNLEIVNHLWNYLGFSTIKPNGPDSYTYPNPDHANHFKEYLRFAENPIDAVAYMGIQRVDVDGDGKDEIAFIMYHGGLRTPYLYNVGIISLESTDDPMNSWTEDKFAVIASDLWELAGESTGEFWGIGALDLNGDGNESILVGGFTGYNIVAVTYNGTGDLLNPASYTSEIIYDFGHYNRHSVYDIRDSLGVIDTIAGGESPFVSKMFTGSDINNNGYPEILVSFQSVFDSIVYNYRSWDGTAFAIDSVRAEWNPDQVTVWMLEVTPTGIIEIPLGIITPDHYTLEQNYPNPFNPTTNIRFSLPLDNNISVKVFDMLGKEVVTLINNEAYTKGAYELTWDGTNNFGQKVSSGNYIAELRFGNFTKSIKMTLLK